MDRKPFFTDGLRWSLPALLLLLLSPVVLPAQMVDPQLRGVALVNESNHEVRV